MPVVKRTFVKIKKRSVADLQKIKNQIALELIEEWLVDESGYDEKVWEQLKTAIETNRLAERRRFDE